MKRLFVMDMKDYSPEFSRFRRPSVRAVIVREGRLALVYSKKFDYYKFPGGGLKSGEDHADTLIREVREETGLNLIEDSISEFGSVLRIQKSLYKENEIFEQENFYYFCEADDTTSPQKLDQYEADEGFTLEFVDPDTAINVNRTHDHNDYDAALIEREARVLEILKENVGNL